MFSPSEGSAKVTRGSAFWRWLISTAAVLLWVVASGWAVQSLSTGSGVKTIEFSGYEWAVKSSSGEEAGPGPNLFGEENVRVDSSGLHLKILNRQGRFSCGEIVSKRSFGYGTYRFYVDSNVQDLAPSVVLGLFTWSDDPGYAHRELDIELSRWGDPKKDNAQFVVQHTFADDKMRFPMPPKLNASVHTFIWSPENVRFRSEQGSASASSNGPPLILQHTFTQGVPEAGGENVRINLWLALGRPPGPGKTEITIRKFEFIPLPKSRV